MEIGPAMLVTSLLAFDVVKLAGAAYRSSFSDQALRTSEGWALTEDGQPRPSSSPDQSIDCPSANPSKAVPTDRIEMRQWSISASCG